MDIKSGDYVLYKGSKAWVVSINEKEQIIILSNWRGIKTTVAPLKDVHVIQSSKKMGSPSDS